MESNLMSRDWPTIDLIIRVQGSLLSTSERSLFREQNFFVESDLSALERVTGIEPAWPAWKAGALPLSYTRVSSTDRDNHST